METKDIIILLRNQYHLTQAELADKLFVTRQAVSRWETGETTPNTETLKLLSKMFDVSINTLLGAEGIPVCQCCGMPLSNDVLCEEAGHSSYCKWCYSGGKFAHPSKEELIDFLTPHMANDLWSAEQVRAYYEELLPTLDHWKSRG